MIRTDGSQQRSLTSNPLEDDSFPTWSPDGSWIGFSRYAQLRIVDRDGARSHPLPTAREPTTSPTGSAEPGVIAHLSVGASNGAGRHDDVDER
jgi:Tol biopolymer transport system component